LGSSFEIPVDLLLVVPVVGKGGVDLAQRKMRQLIAELFRAEAVRLDFRDELSQLGDSFLDDRETVVVQDNVAGRRYQLRPSKSPSSHSS